MVLLLLDLQQMEALQQQWDNTSAAMEALQQENKRSRKHIGRLQQQAEVRRADGTLCMQTAKHLLGPADMYMLCSYARAE
jgi:hypothetical protein